MKRNVPHLKWMKEWKLFLKIYRKYKYLSLDTCFTWANVLSANPFTLIHSSWFKQGKGKRKLLQLFTIASSSDWVHFSAFVSMFRPLSYLSMPFAFYCCILWFWIKKTYKIQYDYRKGRRNNKHVIALFACCPSTLINNNQIE